jgi:hypothetical protein
MPVPELQHKASRRSTQDITNILNHCSIVPLLALMVIESRLESRVLHNQSTSQIGGCFTILFLDTYQFHPPIPPKVLRYIHICIFVNNNEGFRGCINKTDFP